MLCVRWAADPVQLRLECKTEWVVTRLQNAGAAGHSDKQKKGAAADVATPYGPGNWRLVDYLTNSISR